jgi:hypothetical protein
MTFAITYAELSDLINTYAKESEEFNIITSPLNTGLLIDVKKFNAGSITLKGRFEFHIDSFNNGILTLRIKFRNFFYEMLKKILMGIVIKIVMKKFSREAEEVDPTQFIHFRSNTVSIETDNMFEVMNIPIELLLVRQKEGSLAVAFNIRLDRLNDPEVSE